MHEIATAELDSAPVYRVVEGIRIGTVSTGNDAREFTYIRDLALDSAGMLYVLDLGTRTVKVVRPDGTFSHEIGERGSGPKSLSTAHALTVTGDTLIVWANPGLLYFRTNGDLLATKRWPFPGMGLIRVASDNLYILVSKRGGRGRRLQEWRDTVQLFTTKRELSAPVVLAAPAMVAELRVSLGHGVSGPPLLGMNQQWTVAPNGAVLVTDPDSFAIHVKDATGSTIKTILAHPPLVKTTRADIRDFQAAVQREVDAANRQVAEDPIRLEIKGSARQVRPFLAGWHPNALGVSSSGFLVVQRLDISTRPYDRAAEGAAAEWIVFAPSWQVVGRFRTSGAFSLKLFEGCTIYGTEAGEFDEPILVSYRLIGEPWNATGDSLRCDALH